MSPPADVGRRAVTSTRERLLAVACQSERTVLLGTVLLASAVSAATGFVLTQYYSVDVLSSSYVPEDCWLDWGMNIGRHCFSDYAMAVDAACGRIPGSPSLFLPWALPAGVVTRRRDGAAYVVRASCGWLGAPLLGLIGYLFALTIAVFRPRCGRPGARVVWSG